MLTPDLLRRIRQIDLRTRRRVRNSFAGAYESVYKGRGLVFSSVRPYIPGDDVRSIDWKVTARTGEPYIKQHIEDRELTLMLIIDGSPSVLFGTQDQQKRDFAAELGAILAYAASMNNDRAGLLIFSDRIEHYIPPRKGRNHILRLIRDLLTIETTGSGSDLAMALRTVNRVLTRDAILFVLSDFLYPPETYASQLRMTGKQHDAAAIVLTDPLEESFPDVGLLTLRDSETGAIQQIDTGSSQWQQSFQEQSQQFRQARDTLFKQADIARIDIPPDGDYIRALMLYFQQRVQQHRR